jgi:hypothetical protein
MNINEGKNRRKLITSELQKAEKDTINKLDQFKKYISKSD